MTQRELEEFRAKATAAYQKMQEALAELGAILGRLPPSVQVKPTKLTKRQLCTQILQERGPLNIYAIVEEMRTRGFHLTGRNDIGNVRSYLYNCDEFICGKGIFRLRK